jgi:hypothetical protein
MMIINTTRIMGYTAMAFAAAALGTQELAAYQASGLSGSSRRGDVKSGFLRNSGFFGV